MRKEQIREEIIACGRDPRYFISKYVKIRHPTRGLISFDKFDYQDILLSDYLRHRFNIILKARQLGISEITAAFATWLMLFHRDKSIVIMATAAKTAKNMIKKIKTALKYLPKWLMLSEIAVDNVMSIELDNGSFVKAITTSEDAGRSEALSLLILDEAAFIQNLDTLWTGLFPTVSAGGRVIVMSTPNGEGNKFHQLYSEAEEGDNDFHSTMLMWYVHPEHISDLEDDPTMVGGKTSTWFRNEIKAGNMGIREISQELCCAFNSSGATVVSADSLKWIESGIIEPNRREGWDRNTYVWWDHRIELRYFIPVDVARGDGRDHSAAIVFDVDNMEEHAEYYGKLPPQEFAKLLCDLGHDYGNALLVVENNNIGLTVLEHIRLLGYENVYYSRKGDHRPGEVVHSLWGPSTDDLISGFTTSPRTRPLIIDKLGEFIRAKGIHFRSGRVLKELRTFIWNSGRPEAAKGRNDDLVMAAAIGTWIRDTFLAPGMASSDLTKQLANSLTSMTTLNNHIPGASKDPRDARRTDMGTGRQPGQLMQIRLPGGEVADFGWLLPLTISKG